MTDQEPQDTPQEPQDVPPAVYTGEIVLPDVPGPKMGRDGQPRDPRGGNRSGSESRYYNSEFIADIVRAVVAGFKISQLAQRYDIPRQTIYRWYAEAGKDRRGGEPKAVQKARGVVALELETAADECWRVIRENTGTELALKAVNTLVNVQRHRALLLGLNAPIVAQVNVNEGDAKDAELQDMINTAKAQAVNQVDEVRAEFERRQQGGGRDA
jgi:transposase-like protein